ncbi:hypothetical protein L1987_31712 [Smallanthus sonchifolius]|uniref:Uncharacterized protein n=1 Tax=Smallanthus sonchifolius TaxID=185202 RepID=A0ACB9I728_9ASTR|nr:hypothetical protein L1987_31712 [Smallanthus sonchifolius]
MDKLIIEVIDVSDHMPKDGHGSANPFVKLISMASASIPKPKPKISTRLGTRPSFLMFKNLPFSTIEVTDAIMVRDSENVKVKEGDGGGTIRIGTTGKVSDLMMQELETSSRKPAIKSQRIQTAPVSIDCGGSSKRLQRMMSANGGSSSNNRCETTPRKKENMKHVVQQIPMLDSEDLWIDKTPVRGKKVTRRIVEAVDLKCGKNDGDWLIAPIGNQLRRLSFSKISD